MVDTRCALYPPYISSTIKSDIAKNIRVSTKDLPALPDSPAMVECRHAQRPRTILLKTLVDRYISDGQPVGSRALQQFSGLEVSSATIRNVMATSKRWLVSSPHTSAGRVPTRWAIVVHRHFDGGAAAGQRARAATRTPIAAGLSFALAYSGIQPAVRTHHFAGVVATPSAVLSRCARSNFCACRKAVSC